MITPEPGGSTTGEAAEEPRRIEAAERVRTNQAASARIPEEGHLAAKHTEWTCEAMAEFPYIHTLRILRWRGNDSSGSKTNRGTSSK